MVTNVEGETSKAGTSAAASPKAGMSQLTNKQKDANTVNTMLSTQKNMGLMLNRITSPNVQVEKPNKGMNDSMASQMSMPTAAGTFFNNTAGSTHHSSPFRTTIAKGMMTGVGFLGK